MKNILNTRKGKAPLLSPGQDISDFSGNKFLDDAVKLTDSAKKNKKYLFINYYEEKNLNRQKEIEFCLLENVFNNEIDFIIVLCEGEILPMVHSEKLSFYPIEKRPTYKDFFELINTINEGIIENGGEAIISIIANSDIYFDNTLSKLDLIDFDSTALALTRYDISLNHEINFRNRSDSQDSWIFKGNINYDDIVCDFYLGIKGCDNKIAYELKKNYSVFNPSLTIKSYHLHKTGIRNYKSLELEAQSASKPYACVKPTQINSFDINSENNNNEKNILHIGINFSEQQSLSKAISSLGNYYYFDWRTYKEKNGLIETKKEIINMIKIYKPYFIFMQIQTPDVVTGSMIDDINKIIPNVKILNWTGDVRFPIPNWYINLGIKNNVFTAFSNLTDVNTMIQKGIKNTFHLQMGFEENIYKRDGEVWERAPKIIFTGSHYANRFPLTELRYKMCKMLYSIYEDDFRVFGRGWGNVPFTSNFLEPKKEAIAYRSAKIIIGANHFDYEGYSSGRTFRILGSGGFLLTKYYKGIEKDFENKKHLVWWHDFDELKYLIDYYLKNDLERSIISVNGNKLVNEKYRWINRIEKIKQIMKIGGTK